MLLGIIGKHDVALSESLAKTVVHLSEQTGEGDLLVDMSLIQPTQRIQLSPLQARQLDPVKQSMIISLIQANGCIDIISIVYLSSNYLVLYTNLFFV